MRTAKEICKDSIKQLGYGTDEAFIQSVIDEAIAHGMTLAAEICVKYKDYGDLHPPLNTRRSIEFQRDNKVWRKG